MIERSVGFGSINYLEDILKNLSLERVFLVTGKGSYQSSGAKSYLSTLTANKTISRVSDFDVNTPCFVPSEFVLRTRIPPIRAVNSGAVKVNMCALSINDSPTDLP